MIILASFGGIIVVAIAAAAIYDHRARRRGWSTGPTGLTREMLDVDGGGGGDTSSWRGPDPIPFPPGGTGWADDGRGDHTPGDQ